MQKFMK